MSEPAPQDEVPTLSVRVLRLHRLVPLVLLAGLLVFFGRAWTRGTTAGPEVDAQSPADGVLCGLVRGADGRIAVRASCVLASPLKPIWTVITDYSEYALTFTRLESSKADKEADGRFHWTGVARYGGQRFTIESRITHQEAADRCESFWDETGGTLSVNRGRWTLVSLTPGTTRITYRLEVEVAPFPTFLVRSVLLDGVPQLLNELARRVSK